MRQPLPPDQEQQFAVGMGQDGKRRAEPTALGPGVEPVIDRVPVHPEVTGQARGRPLLPEVPVQHVQPDPVKPGQGAATLVRHDPRGRGQGGDEDFGQQVFGCRRPGAPRQVAEHGGSVPLIEHTHQFRLAR